MPATTPEAKAANTRFWEALHGGKYDELPAVIEELQRIMVDRWSAGSYPRFFSRGKPAASFDLDHSALSAGRTYLRWKRLVGNIS
ncbi:MAG TPA: hypothetical protein VF815_07380 [Myxococcaceae bacterium]